MEYQERFNELRSMKICRFCLEDKSPLSNIHESNGESISLSFQIMACVAIEVFLNDGMPQYICSKCITYTHQAYTFKAMCKKSEDALKLYLATGDIKTLQNVTQKDVNVKMDPEDPLSSEATSPSPQKMIKTERPSTPIKECMEEEDDGVQSLTTAIDLKIEPMHYDESMENTSYNQDDEEKDNIKSDLNVSEVEKEVHPCNQCKRSFPLKQLLDLHVKRHKKERRYKCVICDRKFFNKFHLGNHLKTHSTNKHKCAVCNKTFSSGCSLRRHEKTHVDVPNYLCTTCDRTFFTKDNLDAHMETHNKKRPFICDICNKSFVFKQSLERHIVSHSKVKKHKCNFCDLSFASLGKLTTHLSSHAGLHPYSCKICGQACLNTDDLTRHMKGHTSNKPHIQMSPKERILSSEETSQSSQKEIKSESPSILITECMEEEEDRLQPITRVDLKIEPTNYGEETTSSNQDCEGMDNINSTLNVSEVDTKVYPCNQCEWSFPLKQLLDLHIKNHEKERKYKCSVCDKKFFTKGDMRKHSKTHSTTKPVKCVVCKKTFSRELLLHKHEKTHVDVPNYLCTTCSRTFFSKDDLDTHMEEHNIKKPFTCLICNKGYISKRYLQRHKVSAHLKENQYKCHYCEVGFPSPMKLKRHLSTHAGLRRYLCKICGQSFLRSHHLTRHVKSHTSKNNDIQQNEQHKCDICGTSFKRKDSLINHSIVHSMDNLKCVICNTTFDNAKQVTDHITVHLSESIYHCEKCDCSFGTSKQLEKHEAKHSIMEYKEQVKQQNELQEETGKYEEKDGCDQDDYANI